MRIAIVAGEASGDLLGASLIEAIQRRMPDCRFEGIGGPRMQALGFQSYYPMERLSVMGLVEPLKRLPELLRMRRHLRERYLDAPPDLFLGIDSPDFNLAIERTLHQAGVRTAHYVSPSVWAWRQKRILKIKQSIDLMLTLFPFEAAFYQQHGVPVVFVGHPLADQFPLVADVESARQALGIESGSKVVALLPGSRGGEVKLLAQPFLDAAHWCLQQEPDLQFLIPAANPARKQQLVDMLKTCAWMTDYGENTLRILDGDSHRVMAAANVVLMASGTTTLEAMLLKKPMVVAYRMAPLSYAIISRLVKSRFISLPNLLADKALVPELLQKAVTTENLGSRVMERLNNPGLVEELHGEYTEIHKALRCDASERAAEAVLTLVLSNNKST